MRSLTTAVLLLVAAASPGDPPTRTAEMPPPVRSWRIEILPKERYAALAKEWRRYADEHPAIAVARVELSRAMRYAGEGTHEERVALVREAYRIDPESPEALVAMADLTLQGGADKDWREGGDAGFREAKRLAERAASRAPEWPIPHVTLWTMCFLLGETDEAAEHLRALLAKGGIEEPTLDFGYNILVSADSGAVVITNGDNDTYPPLALQAARGVRADVRIANRSLLNVGRYARAMLGGAAGAPAILGDGEIAAIEKRAEEDPAGGLLADRILAAVAEKVRRGTCPVPVYFALTVSPDALERCGQSLELEGLLLRVLRDPAPEGKEAPQRAAWRQTLRLFHDEFRMESTTSLAFPWRPESAARRLVMNYPTLLSEVAGAAAGENDLEAVRSALREAIAIYEFHEQREMARKMAEYWKSLDPESGEPERWLAR